MKNKVYSKKVSVIISFAAFFVVLAALLFVAFPLQRENRNLGLVLTELIMLAIAVVGCVVTRQKFSEMFPVKLPSLRGFFGAVIIWIASYLMSLAVSALSAMLMPERFFEVSSAMNGMSVPFKLFAVAILPPICEEAMHRGLITHFLKPIKHRWIILLVIGIEFGIFHFEPVKFLSTAIAGACFAYVLVKSNNIVLCMLMHFLTNLPAALVNTGSVDFTDATAVSEAMGGASGISVDLNIIRLSFGASAGLYLLICAVVPWLLYAGSLLLSNKGEVSPQSKKKLIISTVASILSAAMGITLLVLSVGYLALRISSQLM